MAEPQTKLWTIADLETLPDDEWLRYEIIDGELFVSRAPHYRHQWVCSEVVYALTEWSRRGGHGLVLTAPGLVLSNVDSVIPDVIWVSRERLAEVVDEAGHLRGAPELAVEVLSPGAANERRDREAKLRLYARQGVAEYWLLDWRTRTVQVWRHPETQAPRPAAPWREAFTLGPDDTLTSPLLPDFAVSVARLFGDD
jgi:Uma2 family endonuclease